MSDFRAILLYLSTLCRKHSHANHPYDQKRKVLLKKYFSYKAKMANYKEISFEKLLQCKK